MKSLKQDQVPTTNTVTPKKQIPSQHLSKYLQYFNLQSPPILPKLSPKKTIRYTADQFDVDMKIKIKEHDENYQIVVLTLKYGYFELQISIFNLQQKSNIHLSAQHSIETTQSIIHFIIHNNQRYVVKCNSVKAGHQKQALASTLKEYFLLKVASSLGVGARISNYFGFDLFVYQNCILFFMEECQSARSRLELLNHLRSQSLKEKLLLMHSINLVHLDIKPENILYCNKKKEFVFIDFGFSRFIEQKVGFKSLSTFSGTFLFCSSEMRALMLSSKSQVDLYYNDAHCLESSIKQLQNYKKDLGLQQSKKYDFDFMQPEVNESAQLPHEMFYPLIQYTVDKQAIRKKLLQLKYKYQIFADNINLLSDQKAKKFIVGNVQAILSFISHHFNKTGEIIYHFLINSPKFTPNYIYSLFNIQKMRFKQFLEVVGASKHQAQKNIFFDHFEIDLQFASSQLLPQNPKTTLFLQENKYEQLQQAQTHRRLNLPKHNYYSLLSLYIDLRASNSTLQQKIKACKIFISKEKINCREFTSKTDYQQMQISTRYMLKYFIETADEGYQKIIPLLISNLFMLQSLQQQQLLQYVRQSLSMSFDKLKSAELLFGLCFLFDWITFKTRTSQNTLQRLQIMPALVKLLIDAYSEHQNQFILTVKQLILPCQYAIKQDHQLVYKVLLKHKDFGDQLMKKLKILYVLNCRALYSRSFSEQAMFVFYEVSHIDKYILRGNYFNLLHIRLFKLIYCMVINPIVSSMYLLLQRCLSGTNILETLQLNHMYLLQNRTDQFCRKIELLCKSCLQSQNAKYLYQNLTLFESVFRIQTYVKLNQQHLLAEMKNVFDLNYLEKMPTSQPFSGLGPIINKFSIIVKIYLKLYDSQNQYLNYVTHIKQSLIKVVQNLQQSQVRLFCYLKLLIMQQDIALVKGDFYSFLQYYRQQIQATKNENASLMAQYNQKICTKTNRAAQIMLDQRNKTLFPTENEYHQYQQMISKLIQSQKIYLEMIKPGVSKQAYVFQSQHLLYTSNRIHQYLQFHNQMLEYVHNYPYPQHILGYQEKLISFITVTYSSWQKKLQQILSVLLSGCRLSSSMLVGLFAAIIYHTCLEHHEYMHAITYLILKNVDFIVVQGKLIILKFFFSIFLFRPTFFRSLRQRRYKFVKFVCYTQLINKLTYNSFRKLMNLNKISNKSYFCLPKQRILEYGIKFYRNIVQ